jgi:hypothetical protein
MRTALASCASHGCSTDLVKAPDPRLPRTGLIVAAVPCRVGYDCQLSGNQFDPLNFRSWPDPVRERGISSDSFSDSYGVLGGSPGTEFESLSLRHINPIAFRHLIFDCGLYCQIHCQIHCQISKRPPYLEATYKRLSRPGAGQAMCGFLGEGCQALLVAYGTRDQSQRIGDWTGVNRQYIKAVTDASTRRSHGP